jgi:DNA-binding beta-propeller fold protein YncE
MKYVLPLLLAAFGASPVVSPALAQTPVPEIAFDSAANPLALPDDIYLGETAGVATNSKGDIFVFTRTGHPTVSLGGSRTFAHGGSRLFEFDKAGKFVREIGANSYGFMVAEQVRIDPQDNIWVVDQMTNYVIKFDPEGRVAMLLGRKAEAVTVPAPPLRTQAIAGGAPGAGEQTDLFDRPTDVAWDAAGNIYVADGLNNARVAKFNKNGVFIKSWGAKGTEQGNFGTARSIAVDARGTVYVGDSGNKRIEVFDGDGNFKTQYTNVGNAQALCITPGPNQVLFVSNSNPPNDIDTAGEIYKMRLDGSVIGKFGRAGKLPKEFGTVNAIDCRSETSLYVGEIGNMRVQKLTLH